MEIGNKIQELRKKENLSQEQLAEKIGVARQTISKWELGETSPDLKEAKELSKIFNVSLDELVGNNINNILIEKVSNTEVLAGMIIKILKIMGIFLLILLCFIIFIFASRKYFEAKPNNMIADSYGLYCTLNNEKIYYEVTETRDNPNELELNENASKIVKEMGVNLKNYPKKERLIKDIEKYIKSIGGNCD